jgi:hypothetical protein
MIKQLTAARSVSTPLCAIRTPDPASTILAVVQSLGEAAQNYPVLHWDVLHGLTGLNQQGKALAKALLDGGDPAMVSARPSEMLALLDRLSQDKKNGADAVVFMANAHRFWNDEVTVQGIWNLRNPFKANGSILIMLTSAGATLPAELADDVLVLDEALPNEAEIRKLVTDVYQSAEFDAPADELVSKAADAVLGLAAFPAEQALAMSLTRKGLDLTALWERKRQTIEQAKGMSVLRSNIMFANLGGMSNLTAYLTRVQNGKKRPRGIVFVDEIEKAFAGTGTDTSGVKTAMTGIILSWMQDHNARGILIVGPPGTGKTAVANAAGNEAGVPAIAFDIARMQGSKVGESETQLSTNLKVIDAVTQGASFWIATCNNISSLPPELRRRFKRGTFYLDLPTKDERAAIWEIYERKYFGAPGKPEQRPFDLGWTGAEIEQCCDTADDLGMTLEEAAAFVVPIVKADPEGIKRLRDLAHDRFIDASRPGPYQKREEIPPDTPQTGRKIRKAELNLDMKGGQA